ncbi:uncharacterized protein LDX57_003012 [Aspergillus melleus]|uniref:uncharacterized protein n=1 Tax=Aspergillus melleus TaxID=138277 RepID=UPI001E8E6111|nr:uncharacterized protein LDX57_003012 [Aspergillus melleus]KAH8425256.1 hypothetical protein LDX57_003012 [Aspergillus melleus]
MSYSDYCTVIVDLDKMISITISSDTVADSLSYDELIQAITDLARVKVEAERYSMWLVGVMVKMLCFLFLSPLIVGFFKPFIEDASTASKTTGASNSSRDTKPHLRQITDHKNTRRDSPCVCLTMIGRNTPCPQHRS